MKYLAFFLFIISNSAYSENWQVDSKTGCKVWNDKADSSDSVEWSGKCDENGFAQGKGTSTWYVNGEFHASFEGQFNHGRKNGKFIVIDHQGVRTETEYLKNKMNGFTSFTVPRAVYDKKGWKNNPNIKGKWKGDFFVLQGVFKDNNPIVFCPDKKDCDKYLPMLKAASLEYTLESSLNEGKLQNISSSEVYWYKQFTRINKSGNMSEWYEETINYPGIIISSSFKPENTRKSKWASGEDYVLKIFVKNYKGVGTYSLPGGTPLWYQLDGVGVINGYYTDPGDPGVVTITEDIEGSLTGTFEFSGYRDGRGPENAEKLRALMNDKLIVKGNFTHVKKEVKDK